MGTDPSGLGVMSGVSMVLVMRAAPSPLRQIAPAPPTEAPQGDQGHDGSGDNRDALWADPAVLVGEESLDLVDAPTSQRLGCRLGTQLLDGRREIASRVGDLRFELSR